MMFAKASQATLGVCFLVAAIPIQASTLDEDSVSPGLAPVHGASPERLHSDAVRLSVSRGTFSGGRFHDQLMLTIPTADGPLRFAIGATGDVNWSDQPSEGNGR